MSFMKISKIRSCQKFMKRTLIRATSITGEYKKTGSVRTGFIKRKYINPIFQGASAEIITHPEYFAD